MIVTSKRIHFNIRAFFGTPYAVFNLYIEAMAKKSDNNQQWQDDDWDSDTSLDDQVERMIETVATPGSRPRRQSVARRIERYREDKLLQARLREVYE